MVEIKIEEKEDRFEVTFVDEDIAMVHAIREIVAGDKSVEFAAVVKEHPEIGHPKLILKVKGDPRALIAKAARQVAKSAEKLRKQLK